MRRVFCLFPYDMFHERMWRHSTPARCQVKMLGHPVHVLLAGAWDAADCAGLICLACEVDERCVVLDWVTYMCMDIERKP